MRYCSLSFHFLYNATATSSSSTFPEELFEQGLSEEVITLTLSEVQAGDTSYSWQLHTILCIGFYRALHTYLKRQPRITKVLIGRFYIATDYNLQEKGSRPDNVYRYIDNIACSKRQSDEPMVYNIQGVKQMSSQLRECSEKLEELNVECSQLKQRFEISRNQLKTAKLALRAITNENLSLKKKCEFTKQV